MSTPRPLKNPSAIFYWTDWENDPELKSCSLAAQGLWMRCLCIAARSSEPGFVLIGSHPPSGPEFIAALSRVTGAPEATVAALIDELVASGAASRDRRDRLYNRRMIRAAALSKKRSITGKKGADVTNGKEKKKSGLPQQTDGKPPGKEPAKSPANGSASSYLHDSKTPESPSPASAAESRPGPGSQPPDPGQAAARPDAFEIGSRVCHLARMNPGVMATQLGVAANWVRLGYDWATEIEPAVKAATSRPSYAPPNGLAYFTPIIEQFRKQLARPRAETEDASGGGAGTPSTRSGQHHQQRGAPEPADPDAVWRLRLKHHRGELDAGKTPTWSNNARWGDPPERSTCLAPHHLLVEFGFRKT